MEFIKALNQAFDKAEQDTSAHFLSQTCSMKNLMGQDECPICYFRKHTKLHLTEYLQQIHQQFEPTTASAARELLESLPKCTCGASAAHGHDAHCPLHIWED